MSIELTNYSLFFDGSEVLNFDSHPRSAELIASVIRDDYPEARVALKPGRVPLHRWPTTTSAELIEWAVRFIHGIHDVRFGPDYTFLGTVRDENDTLKYLCGDSYNYHCTEETYFPEELFGEPA